MTTETLSTPPTRRNFFGHLAGLTAAAGIVYAAVRPTKPHPDADLLAMVDQFAFADRAATDAYFTGSAAVDRRARPTTRRRTRPQERRAA